MFEKLKLTEERYEEITQQLADPSVVSDNERFKSLMKEHKTLTPSTSKRWGRSSTNPARSLLNGAAKS